MIRPTIEQQHIIDFKFEKDSVIKINAGAGTGKSSTLFMFSEAYPNLKMLYVVFSKSVQLEAERKFKNLNTTVKTGHSLAYSSIGYKYKDKLNNLKLKDIDKLLNLKKDWPLTMVIGAQINAYLLSADREITDAHIPKASLEKYVSTYMREHNITDRNKVKLPEFTKITKRLWLRMCDPKDHEACMPHDGYLKLWQLSNPVLKYDVILLDEYQDTAPVINDVFMKQDCVRIAVADADQTIFSHRGARNVIENLKASKEFYLTNSFRFGKKIGLLASEIINKSKYFGKKKKILNGLNGEGEIIKIDPTKKYTLLHRTNSVLFFNAISLYNVNKIAFLGGLKKYNFDLILDTYYLYKGSRNLIKDPYVRSFTDFHEMEAFAGITGDIELQSRILITKRLNDDIPFFLEQIRTRHVEEEDADIILSTAHSSKGLEWNQVKMADDFPPMVVNNDINWLIPEDEFNLYYVAVTRAKKRIEINHQLLEFVNVFNLNHLLDDENC